MLHKPGRAMQRRLQSRSADDSSSLITSSIHVHMTSRLSDMQYKGEWERLPEGRELHLRRVSRVRSDWSSSTAAAARSRGMTNAGEAPPTKEPCCSSS